MATIILVIVLVVTFYLGRYAIKEGQRIESHKEFIKNMNNFDKKTKNDKN